MAVKRETAMSRAELEAEVRRLRRALGHSKDVAAIAELATYREELLEQQRELVESQRLLELSRDRYVDLFDFSPVAHVLLDFDGTIEDVNLATARMLHVDRARLIGFPFLTNIATADRQVFLNHLVLWRRRTPPIGIDLTLKTRIRVNVPVHVTCQLRRSGAQGRPAFHLALVDLSDRRAAEEARERHLAERQRAAAESDAKDRFLAVLSHELRTPLTPVLLALGSVRQRGVPETLAPTIEMIRRNVQLEADLIDDLLDVTRIARGKLHLEITTVDVHAAVEDVVTMLAEDVRSAGLRMSVHLDAPTHHVQGDNTRLRQVLWNVVENAIRHTPRGGRITVRSLEPVAGRLRLQVVDTGSGIEPALLDRVFEPFQQGEPGRGIGLGLGLAICKGIMETHGGSIAADSDGSGRGSMFTIDLPITAAPAALAAPSTARAAAANGQRVLLVEDNHDNAAAITELLSLQGYVVTLAASVREAVVRARDGFDVLVSDIGLPDGTGRDLIRQLKVNGPVRAIALTGYGSERDVANDAAAGFSRHLTKPVDPEDLLRAIDELTAPGDAARAPAAQRDGG